MKYEMKRTVGIILSLALMFGLLGAMSTIAYADSTYSGYVVTSSDTSETLPNKVVKFNDVDWYSIKDESTAANAGTLTLLAKNVLWDISDKPVATIEWE